MLCSRGVVEGRRKKSKNISNQGRSRRRGRCMVWETCDHGLVGKEDWDFVRCRAGDNLDTYVDT